MRAQGFSCIQSGAITRAHKAYFTWVQHATSAGDTEGGDAGSASSQDKADILTQAAREEGMGTTYKVFAITPQAAATPIPF